MYIDQNFKQTMNLNILKKAFSLFIAFALSFCFYSCDTDCLSLEGTGPMIEKSIETENFNAIENNIETNLVLQQGESFSINAFGQSNIIDHIEFTVSNSKLNIGFKEKCVTTNYDSLTIYIILPNLKSLEINGSGQATIKNKFQCENLNLSISGSGDIIGSLETRDKLNASIAGSGSIRLSGSASEASLEIAGSGEIHAFDFPTTKSSISISGSGDAELFAIETLEVSISGSGDVNYKGNPKISSSISGSGELKAAE